MPVTNVVAMSGQTTTADTAFTVSSEKGVYYKITLNAKSLLSFKTETDKDAYPVFNLYNAKGKEAEPLESVSDTEHIYSKGTYYLHYSNDNDGTKASNATVTYHVTPVSKAKTISFKKTNKGTTGSYYSTLYKTKVNGVQKISVKGAKKTSASFLTTTPLGKSKDAKYRRDENELENCMAYYVVSSSAKNKAYSFKTTHKVYYKRFPLPFAADGKVHTVKLNKKYYGHLSELALANNYKFKLTKSKKITLKAGNYYLNCMALSDPGYDVYAHYDFTIKG